MHWGRDKMAAIFQTTFSDAFSWMKMVKFQLRFHWNFVPKGPVNNIPPLVPIMAWCRPGEKPLFKPIMVKLQMHISATRPQWVKAWQYQCDKPHKTKSITSSQSQSPELNILEIDILKQVIDLQITARTKAIRVSDQQNTMCKYW